MSVLVNAQNFRADIKEIETIAKEINPNVEFYINPEAKEFRKSESFEETLKQKNSKSII